MNTELKCNTCKHLVRGYGDEPSLGGGCDNIVRCIVRPEVEEMIRKELKHYGGNGSPFSSWLCGQVAIDVETAVYSEETDEWTSLVEELRDPVMESIDEWLSSLPTVVLIQQDSKWLLRRESQVVEDVLWRAQKGRCWDYSERPDEDDLLLFSHYESEDEEIEDSIITEEDSIIDAEYKMIQEAELPELLLTGHFGFQAYFGFFAAQSYHSAA